MGIEIDLMAGDIAPMVVWGLPTRESDTARHQINVISITTDKMQIAWAIYQV